MKKAGVLLLVFLLVISFAFAQSNQTNQSQNNQNSNNQNSNNNAEGIDRAYQCLNDLIDDRTDSEISLQEAIFSTLALGSDSELNTVIEREKSSSSCWPKSSCTVKDTAQVLLAQKKAGKSTTDIERWLLSQNSTSTELLWYLEIDIQNHIQSSCTLSYQGSNNPITVNEDMTISGNPGNCFTLSTSGFWLRIKDSCIGQEFRISCDEDFVTSLLYQKSGSSTIFVSPETHSAASLGSTEEKVDSQCFKSGNTCDYEGTLWATLALDTLKKDTSSYLPYLLALSEDNKRVFPSSILYLLTQGNDQYSEIVQAQQQSKYWQAPNTPYNRFYDSSLAMLALQGTGAQELANAQSYLLSIQTEEGCWNNNNIRDTSFVLYSGWQRAGSSGGGGSTLPPSCVQATGRECVSTTACQTVGGLALDFDCDLGICCSVPIPTSSCLSQGGVICSAGQTCSGTTSQSLEGSCCLGSCINEDSQQNECENAGGSCYASCQGSEEQIDASCDTASSVCCVLPSESSSSLVWLWVVLLIILIALAVLGILFRNKLLLWFYKLRNKNPSAQPASQVQQRRPPFPPYGPSAMRRPMPPMTRPMIMQKRQQQMKPQMPPKEDKDMEETLRKLREMSK